VKRLNVIYLIPRKNHVELFKDGRVPFADLLLQEAPTCPEAVQAEHLVFLLLLHGFYSSKHSRQAQVVSGLKKGLERVVVATYHSSGCNAAITTNKFLLQHSSGCNLLSQPTIC
jgi:hypothetical protein